MTGAMCAAENPAISLDTVSDDGAIAVGAARGERMDRAFERIERAATPALLYGEALVVVVAADITGSHRAPPALEGACSVAITDVGGSESTVSRLCRIFTRRAAWHLPCIVRPDPSNEPARQHDLHDAVSAGSAG